MEELDLYTGKLTYRNIEFTYVFDKNELRLIPPSEKRNEVRYTILMKKIGNIAHATVIKSFYAQVGI